jgi:hypothetical protein
MPSVSIPCGLYNKDITIVNDDTNVVNKFESSLTDDTRVVIYDRHMFLVHATVLSGTDLVASLETLHLTLWPKTYWRCNAYCMFSIQNECLNVYSKQ